ncbi:MAG: hypothetical protein FWF47_08440, partial [Clostridia bacterium]|nr:hypothetical protein [Clostridia bacterium]
TVLLLSLLLSGAADTYQAVQKALQAGNERYAAAAYADALTYYEEGLDKDAANSRLLANAAQAAALAGEVEKAVAYYEASDDSPDKYLDAGNIFASLGDALEEPEMQAQCYLLALELYLDGILLYPQNVPLKFNYETVLAKIEALPQEDEPQDGQENGENDEDREGERDNRDDTRQDESAEDRDEAETEQGEAGDEAQGNDGEERENSPQAEENEQDREEIERILAILENREDESLKNNREVMNGNESHNGW